MNPRSEHGHPPAWSEIPKQEMDEIIRISQKEGYKVALEHLSRRHPDLLPYILSSVRVDWLFHCYNDCCKSLCLDVGSGWGGLSFPLSNFFEETISLERDFAKLTFQKTRAKQDNIQSIRFLRADMASLPFSNDRFDIIAANGVLEWAAFLRDADPRVVQRDFLIELRRCLKPSGCLYIGIENRFGLTLLLGGRDHTSMPLTSLLPRKVADIVVSLARRREGWHRYYTYTYSAMGYRSLLREAGFSDVDFYWTYPSHTYPKFASRLWDANSYLFFADYHLKNYPDMSFEKRLLAYATKLLPHCVIRRICPATWPEFSIFAWKGPKQKSVEDAIAQAVESKSLVRMSGGERLSSKVSFAALRNDNVVSFAKLSRSARYDDLEAEENLLREHARSQYAKRTWGNLTFFTEQTLVGRKCDPRIPDDNRKATAWLMRFQEKTRSDSLNADDTAFERGQIAEALSKADFSPVTVAHILNQIGRLMTLLISIGLVKCSEHGDFWPANLLISEHEVLALDWEFYRASGNPLFDFCYFLIANSTRPRLEKSFIENLSGRGSYSAIMSDLVRSFCDRYNLPVEAILLGIPYVLSRCVARYSVFSDDCSPTNYQAHWRLLHVWEEKLNNSSFSWIG
jgi:SAM-dependent methyltransferase